MTDKHTGHTHDSRIIVRLLLALNENYYSDIMPKDYYRTHDKKSKTSCAAVG